MRAQSSWETLPSTPLTAETPITHRGPQGAQGPGTLGRKSPSHGSLSSHLLSANGSRLLALPQPVGGEPLPRPSLGPSVARARHAFSPEARHAGQSSRREQLPRLPGCDGMWESRGRTNACFSEWSWNLHPRTAAPSTCQPVTAAGGSVSVHRATRQGLSTSKEAPGTERSGDWFSGGKVCGPAGRQELEMEPSEASGARPPRSRVHSLPRAFVQGLRRSPCSASGDAGAAGTQRRLWPRPEAARGQTERRGVARQGFRPGSWLPPPGSTTGCRVRWPCPATSCPCGAFLP